MQGSKGQGPQRSPTRPCGSLNEKGWLWFPRGNGRERGLGVKVGYGCEAMSGGPVRHPSPRKELDQSVSDGRVKEEKAKWCNVCACEGLCKDH